MNLLTRFRQQIASLSQIDNADSIEISANNISIGSVILPLTNVFFNENDINNRQSCPLSDYLSQYELKSGDNFVLQHKSDNASRYEIIRLQVKNQNIQHGFYEISSSSGERQGMIFTGSFSGSIVQPEFIGFQESLFALCLLDAVRPLDPIGWSEIFESLGAFGVFSVEHVPYSLLADCGIFSADTTTFTFAWVNEIPQTFTRRRENVPQEAETAYIDALTKSNSPDVAFTLLYRVLEILFAVGLKVKIENSLVTEVINVIKQFERNSEFQMLSTLLEGSSIPFSSFTRADFIELYGTHKPEGNYNGISTWLNSTSSNPRANPPNNLVPTLIYYIRCSLVHSKLGDKEPFLLGPFSDKQKDALCHLVDDLRNIIKSLVY